MVFQRIGREVLAQFFAFLITILDRFLLTGLLVRALGTTGFASWTVATAAAGMLTLFDLGFGPYFSNRLLLAVESGDDEDAREVFAVGNALLMSATLFGLAAVVAIYGALGTNVTGGPPKSMLTIVVGLLASSIAVRQALAVTTSVYVAHRQFHRQVMILASSDLVRIVTVSALAAFGGGMMALAGGWLAATILTMGWIIFIDMRRRFPQVRPRVRFPTRAHLSRIAISSGLYWAQGSLTVLFLWIPVFVLAGMKASASSMAAFALIRTLANMTRITQQMFANVTGLEAARRLAVRDVEGLVLIYKESAILLVVMGSAALALIIVIARPVFTLWTGNATLFDPAMLLFGILPAAVSPALMLAYQFAITSNRPMPLVVGRSAQLLLTGVLFVLLPLHDPAQRMMAALVGGELIGLSVILGPWIARTDRRLGWPLTISLAWRAVLTGGLVWLAATAGFSQGVGNLGSIVLASIAAAPLIGLTVWIVGLSSDRRAKFSGQVRQRVGKWKSFRA